MNKIKLKDGEKFDEFYKNWDLTFIGIIEEEWELYVNFLEDFTEIIDVEPYNKVYIYTGKLMNDYYNLNGNNAYPDDLIIMTIDNRIFKDLNAICLPRFQIGGRWFTDIVDNNTRKK